MNTCSKLIVLSSGVVKGECRGTPVPQIFLGGNAIPPINIRKRGNGDTVAFPQIGLQKWKVCVNVNSSFITMKCLDSVYCSIGESVVDWLKLSILTAFLHTTSTEFTVFWGQVEHCPSLDIPKFKKIQNLVTPDVAFWVQKCCKICLRPGLCAGPCCGSLQCSPHLLTRLKGAYF